MSDIQDKQSIFQKKGTVFHICYGYYSTNTTIYLWFKYNKVWVMNIALQQISHLHHG